MILHLLLAMSLHMLGPTQHKIKERNYRKWFWHSFTGLYVITLVQFVLHDMIYSSTEL